MSQLDHGRREARCVLVYHGPRRAGKTETLHAIRHAVPAERRTDVVAVPSEVHPSLVLEHLALRLCTLGLDEQELRVVMHIYALPDHEALPLLGDLLRRADGVVFVSDSQAQRLEHDVQALAALEEAFARNGADLSTRDVPLVFQWNKQDLPSALRPRDLGRALGAGLRPGFQTVATTGQGILAPLREVALAVTSRLGERPPTVTEPDLKRGALPTFVVGRKTRGAAA